MKFFLDKNVPLIIMTTHTIIKINIETNSLLIL
jgi:hypothetical protein